MTERISQRTLVAILGALIAVVLLGGVLAVVTDEEAVPSAGARVRLEGTARLVGADGGSAELHDGDVLSPGDEVEIEDGAAVLELAGGGTIEVRAGFGDVDDSRIEVGEPSRLLAGDALVVGGPRVGIEAAGTLVRLRGDDNVVRVRRELAVTASTYRGIAEVDSAGTGGTVSAYRQLAVASVGRADRAPEPLDIDNADPWDQRFLGSAIALTSSLVSYSRTFTARDAARSTASDYEALLPRLAEEPDFGAALLEEARPDGETLVGAAIAVLGERGDFAERWQSVFEFRDEGAEWGLVALDQAVEDGPVLDEVEAALSRSVDAPGEVAVGPPPTTPPATTPPPGTTPTAPPPTAVPTTAPPTTAPTTPTTAPPTPLPPIPLPDVPLPDEPLPDASGLLQGLLEPVTDLLGGLLGG